MTRLQNQCFSSLFLTFYRFFSLFSLFLTFETFLAKKSLLKTPPDLRPPWDTNTLQFSETFSMRWRFYSLTCRDQQGMLKLDSGSWRVTLDAQQISRLRLPEAMNTMLYSSGGATWMKRTKEVKVQFGTAFGQRLGAVEKQLEINVGRNDVFERMDCGSFTQQVANVDSTIFMRSRATCSDRLTCRRVAV